MIEVKPKRCPDLIGNSDDSAPTITITNYSQLPAATYNEITGPIMTVAAPGYNKSQLGVTVSYDTTVKYKMAPGCEDLKPMKAYADDAAYDIRASEEMFLRIGEVVTVSTGLFIALQNGWEAQIRSRSGLSAKHCLQVVNAPGTIDAGYRGEVKIILKYSSIHPLDEVVRLNSPDIYHIKRGDKIAQMKISKVPNVYMQEVDELPPANRGENGFGSTGT